jgi:hypothetical protein
VVSFSAFFWVPLTNLPIVAKAPFFGFLITLPVWAGKQIKEFVSPRCGDFH